MCICICSTTSRQNGGITERPAGCGAITREPARVLPEAAAAQRSADQSTRGVDPCQRVLNISRTSLALASCASDSYFTFSAPAIAMPSAYCVMPNFFHPPPTSTPRLQRRHQPIRDGGLLNGSKFICFADWYVAHLLRTARMVSHVPQVSIPHVPRVLIPITLLRNSRRWVHMDHGPVSERFQYPAVLVGSFSFAPWLKHLTACIAIDVGQCHV